MNRSSNSLLSDPGLYFFPLLATCLFMLLFNVVGLTSRQCAICGNNLIPYPLSSGENCGDPNYSGFTCNNSTSTGELFFKIANSTLPVIRIDEENRSFYLQLPYTANCSSYLQKQKPFSSVNCTLNSSLQIGTVNIIWDPPPEPICNSGQDCRDWPNSNCTNGNNQNRCICNANYRWNGTRLSCTQENGGNPSRRTIGSTTHPNRDIIIVVTVVFSILILGLVLYLAYRRTIGI